MCSGGASSEHDADEDEDDGAEDGMRCWRTRSPVPDEDGLSGERDDNAGDDAGIVVGPLPGPETAVLGG